MKESLSEGGIIKGLESLSALEAALQVPEQYLKLILDAEGSAISKKEMGFLIRRSDIVNVRIYIYEALRLPVDLDKVQQCVGYISGPVPELEPARIQQFNQCVVQHAGSWSVLERDTKELARKLDTFSDKFLGAGEFILEIVRKIELERLLDGTLEQLTDEEKDMLSRVLLNDIEDKAVHAIERYLRVMLESTQRYIKETLHVGSLAAEFERTLTEELIPDVRLKARAYEQSPLASEQKERFDEIKMLDQRIDELAQEYSAHVGYAFTGMIVGPIGLMITGGIYGYKAETVRSRKNELIEKRKQLNQLSTDTEKLIDMLHTVQTSFIGLRGNMLAAEVGAKQLAQVWRYIETYLKEASRSLSDIDNLAALHLFAFELSLVLKPWKRIQDYSSQLSSAFNEMIDELV